MERPKQKFRNSVEESRGFAMEAEKETGAQSGGRREVPQKIWRLLGLREEKVGGGEKEGGRNKKEKKVMKGGLKY